MITLYVVDVGADEIIGNRYVDNMPIKGEYLQPLGTGKRQLYEIIRVIHTMTESPTRTYVEVHVVYRNPDRLVP